MIVKNEELVIGRILKQVKAFADEIVIVDTGSSDNTKLVAKKYTDKVFDYAWDNNFANARNYSFKMATCDYIMWLDADDYITRTNIKKLKALKNNLDVDTMYMPYEITFNENNKCTFKYLRERIVKNCSKAIWNGAVHEVLSPFGKIAITDVAIKHKKVKANESERNLNIYRQLIKSGKELNTRELFYYANELYYNNYFDEAIYYYEKFLLKDDKFIQNAIQAKINKAKIYKHQNNILLAKQELFETFVYELPKSEVLCELGHIYLEEKDYIQAIYYYTLAIQKVSLNSFAFIDVSCYGFIPNLQLAICYYYLKDYKTALKYNKKALKYNKNSQIARLNQKFYETAYLKTINQKE